MGDHFRPPPSPLLIWPWGGLGSQADMTLSRLTGLRADEKKTQLAADDMQFVVARKECQSSQHAHTRMYAPFHPASFRPINTGFPKGETNAGSSSPLKF